MYILRRAAKIHTSPSHANTIFGALGVPKNPLLTNIHQVLDFPENSDVRPAPVMSLYWAHVWVNDACFVIICKSSNGHLVGKMCRTDHSRLYKYIPKYYHFCPVCLLLHVFRNWNSQEQRPISATPKPCHEKLLRQFCSFTT